MKNCLLLRIFLFFLRCFSVLIFHKFLYITNTHFLIVDANCSLKLYFWIFNSKQCSGMSSSQHAINDHLLYSFIQFQESHGVRYCSTAFCHFFLLQTKFFQKFLICSSLLNRIQILTLDIFDQRDFHNLLFTHITDHNRYFFQASQLCSSPTTLSCNNFIIIFSLLNDQWLQNTKLTYGLCQFL